MTILHATPLHSPRPRPLAAAGSARARGLAAALTVALLAGACSADVGMLGGPLGGSEPLSLASASTTDSATAPKSELNKAIEYWAKEHKAKPTDLKAGLAYARNLKAAGQKDQAFGVLQSLALVHGDSRELASEYGRLALDLGQIPVAQQLLAMADDPAKPDWRVISAIGTVQAKQGKYAESIPYYERALTLAPDQASVLNNLAMAHAANGEPAKAEEILRRIAKDGADSKIQQNLALVQGLQTKPGDGRPVAAAGDQVKAPAPAPPEAKVVASKRQTSPAAPAATTVATARKAPQLRESAGPGAGDQPSAGWDTTVARAQ